MNSESLQQLPPELQQRIANIVNQGAAPAAQAQPAPMTQEQRAAVNFGAAAPAPIQKPPSLMDHLIALRQEVQALRQEVDQLGHIVNANSNVVEGVGQAVGTIYQMFQQTPNQSATYSQEFQQQRSVDDGNDY